MEEEICDMSQLPEVTLVKIMMFLDLRDRSHLSQTCHTLNNILKHPSLWHTITIHLYGGAKRSGKGHQEIVMASQYVEMAKRFGKYFQNLTISVSGFMNEVSPACGELMSELSRNCRLESLTLQIGTMVSKDDWGTRKPNHNDLKVFALFVQNAFRMKCFHLISWPRFLSQDTLNILEYLVQNPRIKDLEELSLYWISPKQGMWTTANPVLPSPEEILSVIKHFTNLSILKLRSTMLDDEIIKELCAPDHKPLEQLRMLVPYTSQERGSHMKTISAAAWAQLTARSPTLKVDFTIMTRVPYFELASLLKPDAPVESITFLRYSRCGEMEICSMTDKYNQTLAKFVDYTDATGCDNAVITLVNRCKMLKTFVYNGTLKLETVEYLAKSHGKDWLYFSINIENVVTMVNNEDEDEDLVLRPSADGGLQTPLVRNYEPEEEREEKLKHLKALVSECIGYKWVTLSNE